MMLHPDFISFEKPKNELYLTFSARVAPESIGTISDIQDDVQKIIKNSKKLRGIDIEEARDGLYDKILRKNKFIYRYPKDTLHFSIANFATYNIVALDQFESAREKIEKTDNFIGLRKSIEGFSKQLDQETLEVEIRRIYLPGGIDKSLALNVFPVKNEGFFEELKCSKERIEEKMDNELISHNLKIKAFPENDYQYFALNIFRFIDKNDTFLDQGWSFYNEIEEMSRNIKREKLKMKLCIVISDPYLANNLPEIDS